MFGLTSGASEYLSLCEDRGANSDGDCPSMHWLSENLPSNATMSDLLDILPQSPSAIQSALFAFEATIDVIDDGLRERFAEIISLHPSHALHALNWRRIVAAQKEGAPPPTSLEDYHLRKSWHSSWNGKSLLPEHEK